MYDSELLHNLGRDRVRFSGNKEAIYDYDTGKHYSYKDMDIRSEKLAWFLTKKLGLKKGDRIGFCALNDVPFFDAYYTTFKTGIIITTYNCLLRETELFALIENEDPKVIFYSEAFIFTILSLQEHGYKGECICISETKGSEADHYCYEDIMSNKDYETVTAPELDFEDVQMLIHTGGTTGRPKAAMMPYRSLFFNAIIAHLYLQVTENDSAILTLPLFHTAGWNVLTLATLIAGGRLIITHMFNPEKTLRIIREERPNYGISVETMYKAMAMHPDFEQTDFTCFRFLLVGAAPTGKELLEIYWNKGVKIVNSYGMTEIGPMNMCHPVGLMSIDDVRAKWNSCGKPAPFNEVRIVDDDGKEVPKGEKGELIFKSKLLFKGYWNNDEATKAMFDKDGYVHSGDIAYLDDDGFCYIAGRKKNMFISGGENIFPQEIEDVIMTEPGVMEACIIGVPDKKWGEVGKALVVLAPGAKVDKDEIVKHVKEKLSTIKVPKYVTFMESIPKNAAGKRNLNQLRELFGQAKD